MDDSMILSLDLPSKFPISHFYYAIFLLVKHGRMGFILMTFIVNALFQEPRLLSSSWLEIFLVRIF